MCCDLPNASAVIIGLMAVLAQDEQEKTSQRTKDALAELKRHGKKLGSPQNLDAAAQKKGIMIRQKNPFENENNRKATALIIALRLQGKSFYKITVELNSLGFKTRRGNQISDVQTKMLFVRFSTLF